LCLIVVGGVRKLGVDEGGGWHGLQDGVREEPRKTSKIARNGIRRRGIVEEKARRGDH
jgi:hypothetical protein